MATRNKSYWADRFSYLNKQVMEIGDSNIPEMEKAYEIATQNIQKEIDVFYQRFAVDNKISFADAKKILNSKERERFQMDIEEYIEKGRTLKMSDEWKKDLKNASHIHRISRLKALQMQMRQQVEMLEGAKETGLKKTLESVYRDGYYKSVYELQKGLGVGREFATLDTNKINKVLSKPWAPDGKNFSQRIWGDDKTKLMAQLETRFTQGIIRGASSAIFAADIAKTMEVSKGAAKALIVTESAFFKGEATREAYIGQGVKKYEVLETLDVKTCSICSGMDGKAFDTKDYAAGVTAPPFHTRCRGTTVPSFGDEFTQNEQRVARDEKGKTYHVPGDMEYPQWYEKYVTNGSIDGIMKSKMKELNIQGIFKETPSKLNIDDLSFDEKHINKDRRHNITKAEAISFIHKAKFSITRWNGKFENYVSEEGTSYVNKEKNEIRTAFNSVEYDEKMKELIKEWNRLE